MKARIPPKIILKIKIAWYASMYTTKSFTFVHSFPPWVWCKLKIAATGLTYDYKLKMPKSKRVDMQRENNAVYILFLKTFFLKTVFSNVPV